MHQNTTGDISLSEYQALAEIRYQIRRFLSFSERMARAAGLESQQHQALLALKGIPEGVQPTVSYLAERLQLQHHSTVELINRLAENDYVRRRRDEVDQRRVIVELTEHGEEILRQLTLAHRDELQSTGPALVRALNAVVESDVHQTDTSRDASNETREVRH